MRQSHYHYPVRFLIGGKPPKIGVQLLITIFFLLILGISWEFGARSLGWESILATPSAIAKALVRELTAHDFLEHLWASIWRVGVGMIFGLLGYPLGVLSMIFRPTYAIASRLLPLFFSTSKIAVYYLLIVLFGIYEASKVGLVMWAAFLFLFLLSAQEARAFIEVPRGSPRGKVIDTAVNWGMGRYAYYWVVLMPLCLPMLFRGLRFALTTSWMMLVVSEASGTDKGLGYLVNRAANNLDISGLWATTIILMVACLSSWFLALLPERSLERRYGGTPANV